MISNTQKYIFRTGVAVVGGSVYCVTAYYTYFAFKRTEQFKKVADENQAADESSASTTPDHSTVGGGCPGCSAASSESLLSPFGGQRAQKFSRIADCYDSAIGTDEFFMGINIMRRVLVRKHANGTVLEVGAGTGRNIPYYSGPRVKRVMLVDASATMLEQAQEKISKRNPNKPPVQYVVKQGDSASLHFCPNQAFDTVVDTFGLCSYEDPVAVLREMVRVCKPGGKILLLEHGRSKSWSWLSQYLDKYKDQHAERWGCIWNRDLDALLEAVGDVMEIKTLNTWHFGTTYYVVCQPKQQQQRRTNVKGDTSTLKQ